MNDAITPENEPTRVLPTEAEQPTPSTHQVRVSHLVFGVLFLGVAALWGLNAADIVQVGLKVGYLVPGVLVLAGVVGLVAVLANHSRSRV